MSREQFGPLGALLDEADFARALVAIGAFYPREDVGPSLAALIDAPDSGFARRTTAEHGDVLEVPVRLRALQDYVRDLRTFDTASRGPRPWQGLLAQWSQITGPHLRLRIDPVGATQDPDATIDLGWLARLLGAPALGAYGVYIASPSPSRALTWEWPLRVGVPAGTANAEFRDALDVGMYRPLYEPSAIEGRAACDVLLLPMRLRDAVRVSLDLPDVRASAVIVAGGTGESASQAQAWLDGLRHQFRAGAVAIAHVPTVERVTWFAAFLAELAHNATLDMALTRASRGYVRERFAAGDPADRFAGDLTPPLLVADRAFVDQAVMVELARRIGGAAARLPQGEVEVGFARSFSGLALPSETAIGTIGNELAREAERVAWHHETGDATVLADFRSAIEGAAGVALRLPPISAGETAAAAAMEVETLPERDHIRVMAPIELRRRPAEATPPADAAARISPAEPPKPRRRMRGARRTPPAAEEARETAPPPPRSVLMEVLVESANGAWERTPGDVAPEDRCALDTFIGAPREGVVVAKAPLDESRLPPSASGHALTLVFTPLWRGADGAFAPAQTQRVQLPIAGDSTHATFYFKAPADLASLRARIVVLFGYRVLQTLVLRVEPQAPDAVDARRPLRLEVENVVSQDFGERTEAPPFDAALLVNDNPQGVPGVTAVATDGAVFVEPEGLDTMVELIRKELEVLNQGDDAPDAIITGLDDERVHRMLRGLAARGAMLTKIFKSQPQLASVLAAPRLQVVDARRGAYLPVEFFYDGKAPLPTAVRCEHALAALEDASVHAACPHNRDAAFYCPAAFWGFSRCIERQPVGGMGQTIFRQPQPGANTLRPLQKSLLAASRRVRQEDLDPPAGVESALAGAGAGVARAASWSEWTQKIASDAPSLLVLLPHSLDSPDFPGVPALEISGANLASVNLEREFVTSDPARAPLVLLLGCSTALPRVPFLNFVGEFKDGGAALVIGTIATIRGRQTGAFVDALLTELRAAAQAGARTFDEVFLRVKQRLLAAGDPFVLSLLAYGDTGWRIEA